MTDIDVAALRKVAEAAERQKPYLRFGAETVLALLDALTAAERRATVAESDLSHARSAGTAYRRLRDKAEAKVTRVEAVLAGMISDDFGGVTAELVYDLRAALTNKETS